MKYTGLNVALVTRQLGSLSDTLEISPLSTFGTHVRVHMYWTAGDRGYFYGQIRWILPLDPGHWLQVMVTDPTPRCNGH